MQQFGNFPKDKFSKNASSTSGRFCVASGIVQGEVYNLLEVDTFFVVAIHCVGFLTGRRRVTPSASKISKRELFVGEPADGGAGAW